MLISLFKRDKNKNKNIKDTYINKNIKYIIKKK